jgi:dsDNA-specific endonuclease/ATPase MutS2
MDDNLWDEYIKSVKKIDSNKIKVTSRHNIKKHINRQSTSEFTTIFSETSFLKRQWKLDLHGLTLDQAFKEISNFLHSAYNNKQKSILIITGKGNSTGKDTLQSMVPRWLEYSDLKSYITSYKTATLELGGSGAIIVHIKKKPK